MSLFEGGFGRNALGVALWVNGALVYPTGEPPQPRAFLAISPQQIALVCALQIGDRAEAVRRELRCADRSDTVDEANRLFREERREPRLARERRKPRGFIEVRGNLCEEFVGGQADGHRDAKFAFDLGGKVRQHLCRRTCRAVARFQSDREMPRRSTAVRPVA